MRSSVNRLSYLFGDHLGSTSVSYQPGSSPTYQRYRPFGAVRGGSLASTDIGYTGQRLDDTGLMYYQSRYYDPVIGRFTQADTIVPNPTDPQDYNRYTYVRNNPVMYTDPSGHIYQGGVHITGGEVGGPNYGTIMETTTGNGVAVALPAGEVDTHQFYIDLFGEAAAKTCAFDTNTCTMQWYYPEVHDYAQQLVRDEFFGLTTDWTANGGLIVSLGAAIACVYTAFLGCVLASSGAFGVRSGETYATTDDKDEAVAIIAADFAVTSVTLGFGAAVSSSGQIATVVPRSAPTTAWGVAEAMTPTLGQTARFFEGGASIAGWVSGSVMQEVYKN